MDVFTSLSCAFLYVFAHGTGDLLDFVDKVLRWFGNFCDIALSPQKQHFLPPQSNRLLVLLQRRQALQVVFFVQIEPSLVAASSLHELELEIVPRLVFQRLDVRQLHSEPFFVLFRTVFTKENSKGHRRVCRFRLVTIYAEFIVRVLEVFAQSELNLG